MGPKIGSGGFGTVYRGHWHGKMKRFHWGVSRVVFEIGLLGVSGVYFMVFRIGLLPLTFLLFHFFFNFSLVGKLTVKSGWTKTGHVLWKENC